MAVGERGTWSFRAAWPAGRYHVTGRAYDVAGMRQATASQATIVVRGSAPPAARAGSAAPLTRRAGAPRRVRPAPPIG